MKNRHPKILISLRLGQNTRKFCLARDYSEAVFAAGGTPLHVALIPDRNYIEAVADQMDGLLLPGSGSDVDPARYGESERSANLGPVVLEIDETDLLLLEAAEKRRVPVLAICFGIQILNVYRGGALYQDINSMVPGALQHRQSGPREARTHTVNIKPGTILSETLGVAADTIYVNSHHHQAIKVIGNDLQVSAIAPDGIIEAVEDPRRDRFVVGVQWHPEVDWQNDEFSQKIFRRFIESAKTMLN